MRTAIGVFVLSVAVASVGSEPLRMASRPTDCSLDGFSEPDGYLIYDLAGAFTVRSVKGVAESAVGPWPGGITVVVELRGPSPSTTIRRTQTDGRGRFEIRDVPEGTYCFKAAVAGWQSVVGKIHVTKRALRRARIRFSMPLDV